MERSKVEMHLNTENLNTQGTQNTQQCNRESFAALSMDVYNQILRGKIINMNSKVSLMHAYVSYVPYVFKFYVLKFTYLSEPET